MSLTSYRAAPPRGNGCQMTGTAGSSDAWHRIPGIGIGVWRFVALARLEDLAATYSPTS
jgi:hypothetical protein